MKTAKFLLTAACALCVSAAFAQTTPTGTTQTTTPSGTMQNGTSTGTMQSGTTNTGTMSTPGQSGTGTMSDGTSNGNSTMSSNKRMMKKGAKTKTSSDGSSKSKM